jgi:hypothetical protein
LVRFEQPPTRKLRGGGIFKNGVENIGLIGCNIGKNVTMDIASHKKEFLKKYAKLKLLKFILLTCIYSQTRHLYLI